MISYHRYVEHLIHSQYPHRGVSASVESVAALRERVERNERTLERIADHVATKKDLAEVIETLREYMRLMHSRDRQ